MVKDKSILTYGFKNITTKNKLNNMSERYTIKQLQELYGVTERTLNNWKKNKGIQAQRHAFFNFF